jgi:hypothetical protein
MMKDYNYLRDEIFVNLILNMCFLNLQIRRLVFFCNKLKFAQTLS